MAELLQLQYKAESGGISGAIISYTSFRSTGAT